MTVAKTRFGKTLSNRIWTLNGARLVSRNKYRWARRGPCNSLGKGTSHLILYGAGPGEWGTRTFSRCSDCQPARDPCVYLGCTIKNPWWLEIEKSSLWAPPGQNCSTPIPLDKQKIPNNLRIGDLLDVLMEEDNMMDGRWVSESHCDRVTCASVGSLASGGLE